MMIFYLICMREYLRKDWLLKMKKMRNTDKDREVNKNYQQIITKENKSLDYHWYVVTELTINHYKNYYQRII